MNSSIFKISVIFILLFFINCNYPIWDADKFNDKGILSFNSKKYKKARGFFEESISMEIKEEIPLYNLAGNYLKEGNYSLSHKTFENAIKLKTDFYQALYNDGHALYIWGNGEVDKNYCKIERTVKLWQMAIERFSTVIGIVGEGTEFGQKSEDNINFITNQIEVIKDLHKKNFDKCKSSNYNNNQKQNKDNKSNNKKENQNKKKNDNQNKNNNKNQNQKEKDRNENSSLSQQEKDKIESSYKRIRKDSKDNTFKQSKIQQVRKGKERQDYDTDPYW